MTTTVSDPTADLYRSIVFIQSNFPSGASFGGSGVMVGPNDVLTASHVVYLEDQGGAANSVTVTPAVWGAAPYGQVTSSSYQYFTDYDPGNTKLLQPGDGTPALTGSEHDVALIDLPTALGQQTGWMQLDPGFTQGVVNITGFPAAYGWTMTNDYTQVTQSPTDSVLFYPSVQLTPGNSGGPVWYQGADGGHVVGVVSTANWAADIDGVYGQLTQWMAANDGLIGGQTVANPATTMPSPVPSSVPAQETVVADAAPANGVDTPVIETVTVTTDGPVWAAVGAGDFNGDGEGDVVRVADSGEVAVWTMQDGIVDNYAPVGYVADGQTLAGVADVNADGYSDLVWQGNDGNGSVWQMQDLAVLDAPGMPVSAALDLLHAAPVTDWIAA